MEPRGDERDKGGEMRMRGCVRQKIVFGEGYMRNKFWTEVRELHIFEGRTSNQINPAKAELISSPALQLATLYIIYPIVLRFI